jgi:hypothetical protein
MQNQILGFFIITTIAMGALCGVQWRQSGLRETRLETLKRQLEEQAIAIAGLEATVKALESDRETARGSHKAMAARLDQMQALTNLVPPRIEDPAAGLKSEAATPP